MPILWIFICVPLDFFMAMVSGKMLLGRTPKGAYSPRGRSRHLLETPLLRTPSENPSRNPFYCKTHSRPPSQNPSENPSPEPFPEPSQNPSQNAVLPYIEKPCEYYVFSSKARKIELSCWGTVCHSAHRLSNSGRAMCMSSLGMQPHQV